MMSVRLATSVTPSRVRATVLFVLLSGCALGWGCAGRPRLTGDLGIPPCPAAARQRLMATEALQCWFTAAHGRWRLVSHGTHLEALVVDVIVDDLRDAEAIARDFVASESALYSEVLVYTRVAVPESGSAMRRVRWTRSAGYDTLEFDTFR
jgi:hypothetical protein